MNNNLPFPVKSHSLMAANCYGSNLGLQVTPHHVKKTVLSACSKPMCFNLQLQTICTRFCNKKKVGF